MPTLNEIAYRTSDEFDDIFDRAGVGKKVSRSQIVRAYRSTRQGIIGDIQNQNIVGIENTFDVLEGVVESETDKLLTEAIILGDRAARDMLREHDDEGGDTFDFAELVAVGVAATISEVQRQRERAVALARAGVNDEVVVGNDDHVGVVRSSDVSGVIATLATKDHFTSFRSVIETASGAYEKEVVAVLDKDTTPCCRNADGQRQLLHDDFVLSYPPAWARLQQFPPFHNYCRSGVIVHRIN